MTQSIREVMTSNPQTFAATTTLNDAAAAMRDGDIGDILVERDGTICGIVTDRDIVVRALADRRDPATTRLGDICSRDLMTLSPTDSVEDAIAIMRDRAIRRLPVCDGTQAVGIVSIGDLAMDRDPDSTLADISAAPANS